MSTPALLPTPAPEPSQEALLSEHPCRWPRDILEAYARYPGPYTLENVETVLEEEPVELYNGWLVWQEMTDSIERRAVANLQVMLDLSARKSGFGQMLPDQSECLLSDGSVVKPDVSLISWQRFQDRVKPYGPNQRTILTGGPELVVEVRSPSNRRAQERYKRQLYFDNNVDMVWDVDPIRQSILVYKATAPAEPVRYAMADTIGCEPFLPDWRRRVADIFAEQASAETVAGEVAQAWREEGLAQGIEEGMAKGIEEGMAKGIEEGMARTLRDVLPVLVQARFATALPADVPTRLALCPLAQLQHLQAAVATSTTLDAWLQVLASATSG